MVIESRLTDCLWIVSFETEAFVLSWILPVHVNLSQIEMRKIAVDQLQRLQRPATDNDVITNDVTSASDVTDERRCSIAGDISSRMIAISEPPQWRHTSWRPEVLLASTGCSCSHALYSPTDTRRTLSTLVLKRRVIRIYPRRTWCRRFLLFLLFRSFSVIICFVSCVRLSRL